MNKIWKTSGESTAPAAATCMALAMALAMAMASTIATAANPVASPATTAGMADAVVGFVKTAQPDASIVLAGQSVPAAPGVALKRGSILHTGKNGSIGVTFKDNTIMSVGPDTEVSVDDYVYDPGKGDLKLGATLSKGSLYYVSGVIAKLKPEAVAIRTPTGTIGVRGTRFLAHVDDPATSSTSNDANTQESGR